MIQGFLCTFLNINQLYPSSNYAMAFGNLWCVAPEIDDCKIITWQLNYLLSKTNEVQTSW